ncbi:MAG: YkgJ family cysteine cluster protein [Nanoarchaeota archaeon]
MALKKCTQDICLECRESRGKCCCQDDTIIPLGINDVNNILSNGYAMNDFLRVVEYRPEEFLSQEDWWQQSFYEKDGKFFRLAIKLKNEICTFLEDGKGCLLGKNRPDMCKIYPFSIDPNNQIIFEPQAKKYCFIGQNIDEVAEGLNNIRETPERIRQYYDSIRTDCINNKFEYFRIINQLLVKP